MSQTISYGGRTQTIREWAREFSMTPNCLYSRIARGWSAQRALETPVSPTRGRPRRQLRALGRTQSLDAWAEETGLNKYTIRERIALGWTPDDAVTKAPAAGPPDRGKYVEAFGMSHNHAQWAELTGIDRRTISKRLQLGWPPEHALGTPPGTPRAPRPPTSPFSPTSR